MAAQPDFTNISSQITTLSTGVAALAPEVAKIGNIPAINGGNNLLTEMRGLRRDFNRIGEDLRTRMGALEERLDGVDERLRDLNARVGSLDNKIVNEYVHSLCLAVITT